MIHIKKRIIILLLILTGIIITLLLIKPSNQSQKPVEKIIQEVEPKKETEKIDEDIEEIEEVTGSEDPVREFLSERLEMAVDFFFTQEINIVTLGDSLTEGIGDETKSGGYVGILDETINEENQLAQFHNFAKRGSRSDQLLSRLEDEEVTEAIQDADIILITVGANDIMKVFRENITDLTLDKFTQEQIRYEQRLILFFSELNQLNEESDIYLIGFYNPFKEYFADIKELDYIVNSWNQIGSDVTIQYDNVHFIPTKDLFENTTVNYLSEDNFHPNHLGYRMIAERVLQYVMNEGVDDDRTEETAQ